MFLKISTRENSLCTSWALCLCQNDRGNGHLSFTLELVDLKNDKVIGKGALPREVTIKSPLTAHELVFNLKGLKFAHAGEYEFRMFANEKIFGQKSFLVSERQKRKKCD